MIGSILTLGAIMKMQRFGFRGETEISKISEKIGWPMQTSMVLLALLCLLTGLMMLPGIRESILDPVVKVIVDHHQYMQLVLGR